jgi:DNA (cytosine-5)-methyltransferase 1
LSDAGFDVTGLDIEPQPHYPFPFILGDMLTYAIHGWDAYWASPPCEGYSMAAQQWRKEGREYPMIIPALRQRLYTTGKPYIIENVIGAPLHNPLKLNAAMFGMRIRRTRLFETSFPMPLVLCPKEERSSVRMGRPVKEGDIMTPVGHFSNVPYVKRQMGIDWMNQEELAHAIPPAYSSFLGKYLLQAVQDGK